jgi:hypothetical protein
MMSCIMPLQVNSSIKSMRMGNDLAIFIIRVHTLRNGKNRLVKDKSKLPKDKNNGFSVLSS